VRFTEFLGVRLVPSRTVYLNRAEGVSREDHIRAVADDHVAIYNAIRKREPSAARNAARAHMYKSTERHELIRDAFDAADSAKG
jgi:DNA-binding FadR family transcriptional regulator